MTEASQIGNYLDIIKEACSITCEPDSHSKWILNEIKEEIKKKVQLNHERKFPKLIETSRWLNVDISVESVETQGSAERPRARSCPCRSFLAPWAQGRARSCQVVPCKWNFVVPRTRFCSCAVVPRFNKVVPRSCLTRTHSFPVVPGLARSCLVVPGRA